MRLGIDIGSLFTKAVLLNNNKKIVSHWYYEHKGEIKKTLELIFENLNGSVGQVNSVGITGLNGEFLCECEGINSIDDVSALISGVQASIVDVQNIVNIGGSSLMLIELNEKGEFLNLRSNSLCAAGTGSFLNQQSIRM